MNSQSTAQSVAPAPVPPYVPYRTFRNFIDGLKQGIPGRIDRSVMPSMSGATQGQLISALRYLGLVTEMCHPTAALAKLVNSEGSERAKALRDVLTDSYAFLFKNAGFNLKTATPRMVEEQFAAAGASGGTVDKCVAFFMAGAKEAEIEMSPFANQRGPRVGRSRQRAQPRDAVSPIANGAEQMGVAMADSMGAPGMTWAQLLLSKFPSFDPAWPDEVKSKWFDAFDKLMKQGTEQERKQ